MNIQSELSSIIEEVEKYFTPEDMNRLKEFFLHNEYGLVLEYLCTQLIEYDIGISHELLEKIHRAGVSMQIDRGIWEDLRVVK